MEFGVPREIRDLEKRVGLTPAGVVELVKAGHKVYIERNAGADAGFFDEHYERAGARIVYTPEEAWGRADVVLKVNSTRRNGTSAVWQRPDAHVLFTPDGRLPRPARCAGRTRSHCARLRGHARRGWHIAGVDADERGSRSSGADLRRPAADNVAWRPGNSTQRSARSCPWHRHHRGRGYAGSRAAQGFVGIGAQVIVLDIDVKKLRIVDAMFGGKVSTMMANEYNLNRVVSFADVLVGAVLLPGERARHADHAVRWCAACAADRSSWTFPSTMVAASRPAGR